MVVICEECGLKYQIDPSKIVGEKARFKCKGCSSSIVVDKGEHEEDEQLSPLEEALLSGEIADDDADLEKSLAAGLHDESGLGDTDEDVASVSATPLPIKKSKSGLGLTSKVIFLMLLVSLLPGSVYFWLSFNQTSDRIYAETSKTGVMVTALLSAEVDEWIDKNVRVLNTVANLPSVKSMSQFDQETVLKALQSEYPWMYLVFTTDTRGMNIARSDGKGLADYSKRQYVKDVAGGADLAWQNLIGKTSKKPTLVLAVPIKNGDIVVGVMAAAMTREAISKLVTTFKQGKTGASFLVDQKGKAMAHQNNAYVLKQRDMSNHPLVKAATQGPAKQVEFPDADEKQTIGFARNTKLGWTLAIQQEKDEAFEPLKKAQMFAYTLLGVTIVTILLIAYFSSRAIVTPIRKLTDAANRISIGDLDVEIKRPSKDEIGDLADAIMRMQDSIRLSISRLKRRRR